MKNISIKLILLVWCLALQFPVFGFTQRNLLQKAGVSVDSLKKVLIAGFLVLIMTIETVGIIFWETRKNIVLVRGKSVLIISGR